MTGVKKSRDAQTARYEFKYVIDVTALESLRSDLKGVMESDPNAVDGGYQVTSLYFDTSDASAYFEKLEGIDHRYKIRMRYYGQPEQAGSLADRTVFLEAKHRHNALIHKNRVRLSPTRVGRFLAGNGEQLHALRGFVAPPGGRGEILWRHGALGKEPAKEAVREAHQFRARAE